MKKILKVKGTKILDGAGKTVQLKGVNLGGWLMMEGYIMHSPNIAVRKLKENFSAKYGDKEYANFLNTFRANFIKEEDFKNIKAIGCNCIRLPFHYNLVEESPYKYSKEGAVILDKVFSWAKKYGIWIILDLHAALGSQNHDWHSDSLGAADFWFNKENQNRVCALWQYLADRYKNEENLAGYDLLNEPVLQDTKELNRFYKELIRAIRAFDKNHILFIEGNTWAQDVECLEEYDDDNYALSIHNYVPLEFTFNFVPHLKYPLKETIVWNAKTTLKHLEKYAAISKSRNVPVFVGEFGVNYRGCVYGEEIWLKDILACFNKLGFSWTYWTYKAVKNSAFPDGLFSYYENPVWVNRAGPVMGWDTYPNHWEKYKDEMVKSWDTKNFKANKKILEVIKDAL